MRCRARLVRFGGSVASGLRPRRVSGASLSEHESSLPIDFSEMNLQTYLLKLERNLMTGSARWIADFTESFRDYSIQDERFQMVVTGSTRPRGFFLSRLFAYFSLPNYSMACFVRAARIDGRKLDELVQLVSEYMKETNIAWSWIVIPQEGPLPVGTADLIKGKDINEIGIALVDVSSGDVVTNPSYVGRRMADHVKCFR